MATTACTSYNTAVVVGYVAGSGSSVGNVVTFNTPHPIYTEADSSTIAIQCSAITIGGFNGLNS